ncbi:beach-domain-containing protein [Aureobasidium pullulans]|uniref:Beach-domain-containing protein n=1 Tax=Aureobasidium pullulans TaxID=5580 RepID=A0A4S8WG09_AURPU|nr:beach-domain-containing protein [Aureobasidium pullulans]
MDNRSPTPRRYRSSTSNSSPPSQVRTSALGSLIQRLSNLTITTSDLLRSTHDDLIRLSIFFDDNGQNDIQDQFRQLRGFQAIVHILELSVQNAEEKEEPTNIPYEESLTQVAIDVLSILNKAMRQHHGNTRYFTKRVSGGGWKALRRLIQQLSPAVANPLLGESHSSNQLRLFGALLALALGDNAHSSILNSLLVDNPDDSNKPGNGGTQSRTMQAATSVESVSMELQTSVRKCFVKDERIVNSEAVTIMSDSYRQPQSEENTNKGTSALSVTVLTVLDCLIEMSERNRIAVHDAGALTALLPHLTGKDMQEPEKALLRKVCASLLPLGTRRLEETAQIFKLACEDDLAKEMLLDALQKSKQPSAIQFDLSHSGHCSIELASLPRPFPPAAGYTFSSWIKIDQFDSDCHTTVFGAFDASQTCFVLVYIEKDTHQLILQTSVTAKRPSVRFKKFRFAAGEWYHIALVHRPSRTSGLSPAILYVNGRCIEEQHCPYPEIPPLIPELRAPVPSQIVNTTRRPVQAFFGTPQDLASQAAERVLSLKWSLARAYLIDSSLSPELIAVHQKLGPRYCGNFQDCVGPFLTYRASAELNRYNEMLHAEKDDKSEIVKATQSQGSELLPEGKLLISISASGIVNMNGLLANGVNITDMLDEKATAHLQSLTRNGNPLLLNAARPIINDAITRSHGAAIITGSPVLNLTHGLDDGSWQIGGCLPINMKIIQSASSADSLVTSVELLFQCILDNWRTSEVMEKDNGFGILAVLLREKLGIYNSGSGANRMFPVARTMQQREELASRLLKVVLKFVGYDTKTPENSLLINPMAYRVLLVDFDTWRTISTETQKLYYQQIAGFVWKNNNQTFNMKRYNKMRVVRRFLDALKVDPISSDVLPEILHALRALSLCKTAHLNHRDIATFITYALHDDRALQSANPLLRTPRNRSTSIKSPSPRLITPETASPTSTSQSAGRLSQSSLGVSVVETYSEVLCGFETSTHIKRFDQQVPTRWILHLLAEPDSRVVASALSIISRAIVDIPSFKSKFTEKNNGFTTLQARVRSHWTSPKVWMGCFAILFGRPFVSQQEVDELTIFHLMEAFTQQGEIEIRHPEIFPAISGMLEAGLRTVVKDSLHQKDSEDSPELNAIPKTVIQFLTDVHARSKSFRDFAVDSHYVQELLFVLFPLITSADRLNASAELASESPLNFQGREVVLRPHSNSLGERPAVLRSGSSRTLPTQSRPNQLQIPRRTSSFVFVNPTASEVKHSTVSTRFNAIMSPTTSTPVKINVGNAVVESLLELVVMVYLEQVSQRKDFAGFGLFLKVPPGFQEHQAYFESYVLLHTMHQLWNHLQLNQELMVEPRTLTNLARYSLHMAEAVFEGWFIDGAQPLLDFTGKALEYLQQPAVSATKGVRLCSQAVSTLRSVFLRVTLLRLSELDEAEDDTDALDFLRKMTYWQTILFSPQNQELPFIRLICYLLYIKMTSPSSSVRHAAASLWRMLLVQKPTEAATILIQNADPNQRHISTGLIKLAAHDDDELLQWIDQNRKPLDEFFHETMSRFWDEFVGSENQKTEDSAKNRLAKRKEKLKQWRTVETELDNVAHRFEVSTRHWRSNIHSQERLKYQGTLQDQQENLNHIQTVIARLEALLKQPSGLFPEQEPFKWQLDQTESRNRMRIRIVPDTRHSQEAYQPKRKASERMSHTTLRIDTQSHPSLSDNIVSAEPTPTRTPANPDAPQLESTPERPRNDSLSGSALLDGEFEMVDDPKDGEEGFEDKNRKVLKSLQRGDRVQNICNVSRVVGLEAFEGLLIIGKKCLYLQDEMFQRSDGEIVSVAHAPDEERDPYVQLISGKEIKTKRRERAEREPARHWTWQELLHISKRRFLFRDVALEVFFTDGRSYLLTFMTPNARNEVYSNLVGKSPLVYGSLSSLPAEDAWRLDSLRNPEETPQSFGSKFANVFNSTSSNAATRRWSRGEISNFQYLMLVNNMAGRTFNDLTQYPVFPWILADYTSEELDLTDPRSFRDLSKPMGCQHPARESEFRDRYRAFAEMGDEHSPPFHYGTHYSSAMIVSSYLIRLPPFVQSYLLLQGGVFDHADRLFDSIEKAWLSASKENMTDVRELTPEFFCLPEFLQNINGYDFGQKQGSGQTINHVVLPPWAKGDPHIFIAKHREALESPYVSQHLQEWIDLIFGYKQRGEAALEATNVFHHLSYQGAKDLDTMQDEVEKLATIGIIHNFGQTPHQVFQRAHPRREDEKHRVERLDTIAESLIKLPFPLHESHEKVAALTYSPSQERLLCSPPCKLNVPPACKSYLQWGFADNSLRFFTADNRRMLGLYENLHIGQISTALFADSKTLITGGADSTIGVWTIGFSSDTVDIQSRTYLFGHRTPISVLAASRAFSTLVSASTDGQVFLWDLNRFDCVRVLQEANDGNRTIQCAKVNNLTGHIMLCSGAYVRVLTLNGHLLVEQKVCDAQDDEITCCAFYEGAANEWVERVLLFTGHKRGIVNVWSLVTLRDGAWHLQLIKRLMHVEPTRGEPMMQVATITSILPMSQAVYTGDEDGKVYEWNCVQRHGAGPFAVWR